MSSHLEAKLDSLMELITAYERKPAKLDVDRFSIRDANRRVTELELTSRTDTGGLDLRGTADRSVGRT